MADNKEILEHAENKGTKKTKVRIFSDADFPRLTPLHRSPKTRMEKSQVECPVTINQVGSQKTKCRKRCRYCQKDHRVTDCHEFLKMSSSQRRDKITEKGLCLNCLSSLHAFQYCPSNSYCGHCGQRHNTLICADSKPTNSRSKSVSGAAQTSRVT